MTPKTCDELPSDWNVTQTVLVTAYEDRLTEPSDPQQTSVSHAVQSADPNYNGDTLRAASCAAT